jgi:hypothetical protein
MNIRWLHSNRTLLALLAVTMVTVGLLATLVMRQQHDQPTETGQVYLDKAGGGTNTAVPLIPANPPQAATGDHGVDSAPAPQPGHTDSASPDKPAVPANPSSHSVTHSNRSAHPETVTPSRGPGHSHSAAAGADKPADAGPPRDVARPDPSRQAIPPARPSPPREPSKPSQPIEADEPDPPRKPTEPGKTNEHDKPGKSPDGKPGKPAGEGKPGKPSGGDKPGKAGKPTESVDASESNEVRTEQVRKSDALDGAGNPQATSAADQQGGQHR